jgi:outer membrane protein assembly factor BamA
MKWNVPFILLALLLAPAVASAKEESPAKGDEKSDKTNSRIISSPFLYYTPETNMAFGLAGSFLFRESDTLPENRPSVISPLIIYTLNKQFKTQISSDIYLQKGNYVIKTEIKLEKYPDKYFGIGNDTLEANQQDYTSQSFGISLSLLREFGRNLKAGLQYSFSTWTIKEWGKNGLPAGESIPGNRGGIVSGPTFLFNLDNRDNIFSPSRGELFEMDYTFINHALGSDFNFHIFRLNLRKYVPLFSSHVLAFQSLLQLEGGDVPFYFMSQLGGQNLLRGYYQGRFRDKDLIALQVEYRLPIIWKLGGVAFAGIGQVADRIEHFAAGRFRYTIGTGLRYLFDKKEKIQIRADIGFGRDTTGFYFSIYEAF